MRDFKGMKRNRNRNRGSGGGGGGPKPQHNANRAFDSNGPEGIKVRGAAQHVYEKYQQLARDAQTSGDRVLAENYLQHAEHYFRLLRAMQPQRPVSDIIGRDQFVSGYDIDFEEEPVAVEAAETDTVDGGEQTDGGERPYRAESRYEGDRRQDSRSDNRYENDRRSNDRYEGSRRDDRFQSNQNDRNQGERGFGERPNNDRYGQRNDQRRDDRFEGDRRRDDRGQQRPWREDRFASDRPRYNAESRPQAREGVEFTGEDAPTVGVAVAEPETPVAETERLLRADDGEVSAAPAFLQARTTEGGEEARRAPRRRRAPRTFEPAESSGPSDDGV